MTAPTVGVLHPGEMGAAIGAMLAAGGTRVSWASIGRSAATRSRAEAAGLAECRDVGELAAGARLIVSICPPAAALSTATEVAATGFDGLFVDANAISPATARRVAAACGTDFVDADVIGGPPTAGSPTRISVSGPRAAEVIELLAGAGIGAVDLGPDPVAASALKMCYAAWTKGHWALLAAVEATARHFGVEDALLEEWSRSQPGVAERVERLAPSNAHKAWRFVGEMEEVAATLTAAGLPAAFGEGAAEVYRRLAAFKSAPSPTLDDVLGRLLG